MKYNFKKGDIIKNGDYLGIFDKEYTDDDFIIFSVYLQLDGFSIITDYIDKAKKPRLAVGEEIVNFHKFLAEHNRYWDPKIMMLEVKPDNYNPNNYTSAFLPKDWCLMRNCGEEWCLCQYSHTEKNHFMGDYKFMAVGGNIFDQCIYYNNATKALLGTIMNYE